MLQIGEGPSRGLLRDCEIFANLRFKLSHHVHHLPPDVLDGLPQPRRRRPRRDCLPEALRVENLDSV